MPVATPDQYAEIIAKAKAGGYALPAINVSSSQTVNAVLQGLAEAGSDGILQVSTGGADYFSGPSVKQRATGAIAFAKYATEVAKSYPITVALHTDHCPKDALDSFVLPLVAASEEEVKAGREPLFQSHMWDGSAVPLAENIEIAKTLLPRMKGIGAILEVEIGVVGGEEDGVSHEINDQLYTTLEDVEQVVDALGLGEHGKYIAALTFGNVHGVYKPGNVVLRPELLGEIQAGIAAKYGTAAKPLDLVFHGGSGSSPEEIATAVGNGVIKMNIDTDTQYAFTRSIADYMLKNYDGVIKV
ncbi:MAG: class II fructose-bisphosphate aldolase, partial [Microbacteriaceae bacterium]|nr:class II fructose-bisphosphate aldolase [Microbacteriaceae bacterium]